MLYPFFFFIIIKWYSQPVLPWCFLIESQVSYLLEDGSVLVVRLELTRPYGQMILSHFRLPITAHEHKWRSVSVLPRLSPP